MWALYSPPSSTFAFEVTGGEEAFALLDNIQIMKLAVSLGGAETLISHRASITLSGVARELCEEIGLTDAPIRISVGIENVEDSISEIAQGLERVTRRQKPWARKPCFSAGDECFRRGNAGDHVGQSDVAARCYVARWPFAVPEVAACFDCAVAVDGSLEMRVHPRRDRGEPCAPKAEFVPGLLGSRLERRQGRPYQQSCGRQEGAGYLGASGRASVRALLAVKRRSPSRRRRLGLR